MKCSCGSQLLKIVNYHSVAGCDFAEQIAYSCPKVLHWRAGKVKCKNPLKYSFIVIDRETVISANLTIDGKATQFNNINLPFAGIIKDLLTSNMSKDIIKIIQTSSLLA